MTIPVDDKAVPPKKPLIYKLLLLCALLTGYFVYLNIQYDLVTGGLASLLTVLSLYNTPEILRLLADAAVCSAQPLDLEHQF